MAFFVDVRLCLIILFLNCLTLIVSTEKPRSPETYFAVVNSTASLPCVAGHSRDKLNWLAAHADLSLRRRLRTFANTRDPVLWIGEITGVRLSDAGKFVCTDGSQSSTTELVVFEPSSVRNVEAILNIPDEIKVRWKAPSDSPDLVKGYNIYVTEVGQAKKEVKITVNDISFDGQEEYPLTDFSPGAEYEIQVAPLYIKGVEDGGEVTEGPRSPQVKINPPKPEPVPWNVKAEPWYNSTILVTWLPPRVEGSSAVTGYIVNYKALGKKDGPGGEVNVMSADNNNQWSAVLKVPKSKNKYKIQVAAYTGGSKKNIGEKSREVLVAYEEFLPELSIRAIPVSADTVVVTIDTVGGDKVDKLRVLYSDNLAIKWIRVDSYNSKEKYAVITGLQPSTRYFFNAKATVNKKARSVVTHVLTPPTGFSPSTNISVSAKSESSVLVTWIYDQLVPAKGFIIVTENLLPDGSVRPVKQNVVFKQNEAVVDGLESGEQYQVKVEPFDLESIGTCGDPVLFQLSKGGETQTTPPETQSPRFTETVPRNHVVKRGDDVRLSCSATGHPVPVVSWYKDNVLQTSAQGRAEFVESRVSGHFNLTCVAYNSLGSIDAVTTVYIRDFLRPPSVSSPLPSTIEAHQGDSVTIYCVFDGIPTPEVTWYNESIKLGESILAQNSLKIDSVESGANLTCHGENIIGFASQTVELKILPKEQPRQSDYLVELKEVKQSPTEVKVKWAVQEGNINDIRYFEVKLLTNTGNVLINRKQRSSVRSETFKRLLPNTRYIVNVQTGTSRGVVDNSSLEFTTSDPDPSNRRPVLSFNIAEVRDTTAMLDFSSKNLDPRQVPQYRVRVLDLHVNIGNTILNRENFRPDTPIILENLKPNRNYQVIVDALARNGAEVLTAIANFSTPGPGQYGTPVDTISHTAQQNGATSPTTVTSRRTPPTIAPRRTPPTIAPRTLPTTATTQITTTEQPLVVITTGVPVEEPESHDYVMTTKIPTKTPYSVDIRWTVDRGPLENIKNFLVTIKGERGNTLLEQTLPANQRYITIQSLNANTKYFVNVKANGPQGVLKESEVSFQTDPANVRPDTSNPVLELEANEVRAHNTRIDWNPINVEPELVTNYRLRVLDGGPDGFNLLNQKIPASSQSLSLQQLQPNMRYHVILEALTADNNVLMTTSLTFQTPSENRYGVPVSASSRSRQQTRPDQEQLSKSQTSHLGSPRGRDYSSSDDPVLEMRINPLSHSSSQLAWAIQNMPPGLVVGYDLRFKRHGPEGNVILEQRLALHETIFKIDGLDRNIHYFVELDALSQNGSTVASASTLHTPGTSVTPIRVTLKSNEQGLSPTQSQRSGRHDDDNHVGSKPEIDLELNPAGHNQVKVNWTVINDNQRRPVASYKIKVYRDGPEGQLLLENQLSLRVVSYTVNDLLENIRVYIHLDALDKYGNVIEHVGSSYLVPPPGYAVEPIRTSSVFNKDRVTTTTVRPNEAGDSSPGQDLIVRTVEAQGPTTMLVEWAYVQTDASKRQLETIVRYAEFTGNIRGAFKILNVQPGQNQLVITNLKPDTTYGIQLAARGTGGYHVKWTNVVMRKTPRV